MSIEVSAGEDQATRTGAQRSPYLSGWYGWRRSSGGSSVAPSSTNLSPVAALSSPRTDSSRDRPPGGSPSGRTTTCTGRQGSKVTGVPSGWVARKV